MNIYFIANSIYQFAYAFPVFEATGGTFVVHNSKKLRHFKSYLKQYSKLYPHKKNTLPQVKLIPKEEQHLLKGVLVFFANSIDPDKNYKNAITCFYEHGTSDKRYEGGNPIAIKKLNTYNYLLLSGPKNKQRLLDTQIQRNQNHLIETGCLRFDDYLQNKFPRKQIEKQLGIRDTSKPNILYAPTWKFGNGTFKTYASYLIEELTPYYNLILRPHYHDRKYGQFLYWLSKLKGQSGVYFSAPQNVLTHDTYAAFSISDLLISDVSSVIYEYLVTLKPIVLIENNFQERHSMPKSMDIVPHVNYLKKGIDVPSLINHQLKTADARKQTYKELLNNCFYKTKGGAVKDLSIFLTTLKQSI